MARVNDGIVSGLIGSIIFYQMDGKQYARSTPARKRKKSKESSVQQLMFRDVSRDGTLMLKTCAPDLDFPPGRSSYNSLRGWMLKLCKKFYEETSWHLSSNHAGMSQLNPEVDLRDVLKVSPQVRMENGEIIISFSELNPQMDITAPSRTKFVNVKALALTSPFKGIGGAGCYKAEQKIPYQDAIVSDLELTITPGVETGQMCIVVLTLQYETSHTADAYVEERKWLPAAAIAMGRTI